MLIEINGKNNKRTAKTVSGSLSGSPYFCIAIKMAFKS